MYRKRSSTMTKWVALSVLLCAGSARAATVEFVSGTILAPPGVREKADLALGTVIVTGADGLAMVVYIWRSEYENYPCIHQVIFGYGQSHTVTDNATPGRCETTLSPDLSPLPMGSPSARSLTRYGDGKFDASRPPKVAASHAQAINIDAWIANARAQKTTQTHTHSIQGDYIRAGSNVRISIVRTGDTTYKIEDHSDEYPWLGTGRLSGSQLEGEAWFRKSPARMKLLGTISQDRSIRIEYHFIVKQDGSPGDGVIHKHVLHPR